MTELSAFRLYLDSNVFIYAGEGSEEIAGPLEQLFGLLRVKTGIAVTSELTLAEVLPKADANQRRYYLNLIVWSGIFELRPVSREILIETASYRRIAGMPKLADSIHVVTAFRDGCGRVLSSDIRMKLPDGMSFVDASPENVSRLISELS
ncbi:MAG: type II toxin-antitoxin system VapC family toxin [Rhodopseudomonas sp.]|uniref:type II toxin-antitoxin system VapC family toxin n=1 Tax=Rhodopseudomonas sp. TaxID=1078 RepID=UPI0017F7B416|nr:type II toxin-antitoxin system VapC family toxin [Rhodopseudomonas sp.]NVN87642.1 type II toxin-antitoxin system VapC family toxin [Rhodopseudomonas sp.]